MIKYQYLISGKVQRVGFRFFVEKIAIKMNIKGYIKNLDNGKVEILAFFNSKDQIVLFEKSLKEGNGYSKIEEINKKSLDNKYPFAFNEFKIYY